MGWSCCIVTATTRLLHAAECSNASGTHDKGLAREESDEVKVQVRFCSRAWGAILRLKHPDPYMHNAQEQLNYQGAIQAELPIGSGEVESAHRYVILDRLDIAGSWWTAEYLMSTMTLQENGGWNDYWKEQTPYAA